MRGKIRRLEEALECSFFTDEHAAQISQLTATIEKLAEPYLSQIEQLDAVPGIGLICAQDIIAESGTDMAVFPTASHLVSWARFSPQVRRSAGKRKGSNATGRGNPYLGAALGEAGISAGRPPAPGGKGARRFRCATRACSRHERPGSSPPPGGPPVRSLRNP
jgi:transposase